MTGTSPKDATKLVEFPLIENYPPEDTLPKIGLCHYMIQLGKEHNDQRKRVTDRIWSKATYRLSEVVSSPGNQVIYYLADRPKRGYIKEELMFILKDTELPPNYVPKW